MQLPKKRFIIFIIIIVFLAKYLFMDFQDFEFLMKN